MAESRKSEKGASGAVFLCAAILAVHVALILFYGIQKGGFHEDEYYSYYSSAGYIDGGSDGNQ